MIPPDAAEFVMALETLEGQRGNHILIEEGRKNTLLPRGLFWMSHHSQSLCGAGKIKGSLELSPERF
jgi:hypothetical protein